MDKPTPSPRRWQRLWVPAAIAGAVIALVTGLDLAGWPGLAPWLVARYFGDADRMQLSLAPGSRLHLIFTPRLLAPALTVHRTGDPQALAEANGLALHWQWRDVWNWQPGQPVQLLAVDVQNLNMRWQRDAAGHSNWQFGTLRPDTPPMALPEIAHLRIGQGTVHVNDDPMQLQALAHFSTDGNDQWHADVKGQLRGQALTLQASASAGLPLVSKQPGPPVKLKASLNQGSSQVSFEGQAASLLDARELDGQVQVSGASMAAVGQPLGVSLPRTKPFNLRGRLRHSAAIWYLESAAAKVGQSHLAGDFVYTPGQPRGLLTGTLRGGPLFLADLGPAIGTDQPPKRAGRVLPDRPFSLPKLAAMDARLQVHLSSLDSGTAAVAPLKPLDALVTLDAGVLRVSGLKAGVAGGSVSGESTLDSRVDPPLWTAKLALDGLAVDRWLPVLRHSRPGQGQPASLLSGRLQANADVHGSGRSVAELLGSLDGELNVALRNGQLSHLVTEAMGLDIAQGLGVWLRGDDNLPLNCAVLQGRFKSGVLRPRLAVIDNRDSRIELTGQISLLTEALSLRAVTRPKDFSPLTLRAPLRVEGTLGAPRVALEGRAVGVKAIAAIALGALLPPAALLPFLDPGESLPPLRCP